jgi:hypothetical protein
VTAEFGLHAVLVPPLGLRITALSAMLVKAGAHLEATGGDEAAFLGSRLAPDMWPLLKQVQVVSDFAKNGPARLAGREPESWPDTETDLLGLSQRLGRNLDVLAGYSAADHDARAFATITFPVAGQTMQLSGLDYVTGFVLPNFYFHLSMAYALMRHGGVPLGKRDFMGL